MLEELLREAVEEGLLSPKPSREQQLEILQQHVKNRLAPCQFKEGDIITQKPSPYDENIPKYKFPAPGDPAIVVKVFDGCKIPEDGKAQVDNECVIAAVYTKASSWKAQLFAFDPYYFEKYKAE